MDNRAVPQGFCNALKNWEGEPTDVFMQQDVSEFFNLFFQQVRPLPFSILLERKA